MVLSVLVCAPFFMFAILILLVPGRLSVRQRSSLASELDFDTNPNPIPSHGQMTRVWRDLSPDSGFGFGFSPSLDSDRFRHSGLGFGSVPQGQVRIRIGSAGPGSDSNRTRLRRFGFCIRTRGLGMTRVCCLQATQPCQRLTCMIITVIHTKRSRRDNMHNNSAYI